MPGAIRSPCPRPPRRARRRLLVGVGLALAAGCAVGPAFHTPPLAAPPAFLAAPAQRRPLWPDRTWWRGFRSPALDHLITLAERHNFSIQIAAAQLEAANAEVTVAGAPLLPQVNLGANAQWQRAPQTATLARVAASPTYGASAQIAYMLDLWGKNRDALQAALADAAASRFNRATVALTAVTAVATTWFQVLADRAALRIGRRNLAAATALLTQLQAEFAAGTVDAVTVAQQAALVASERATIPALRSQLRQEALGLGLLVGRPPERLAIPGGRLRDLVVPPLAPGLPSQLLERRPDVAQAVANLRAANANVRSAIASFFPTINLTGSASTTSTALRSLLAPGSLLLNAATAASQPLFAGGALTGQLAVSRAVYREDVVTYEETVVRAFTNVETTLTALHYATEQQGRERQAVIEARRALRAVQAQLQAGIVNVSSVLTAEETLLGDENAYTQARLAQLDAAIDLYQALGGGWRLSAARHMPGKP